METRVLTINLRRYLVTQPRTKRARKASRYLKERIAHYTKTEIENVKIDRDLNSMIVKYYSKRMKPVKASVRITDGIARVFEFGKDNLKPTEKRKSIKSKIPFMKSKSKKEDVKTTDTKTKKAIDVKTTKPTDSKTKTNSHTITQPLEKESKPDTTEKVQKPKEEAGNGGSKA